MSEKKKKKTTPSQEVKEQAAKGGKAIAGEKKPEENGKSSAKTLTASEAARKKHSRKVFKHTTMATVLTVVFIAAVVMVNIIASIIFERYPLTIDLTENSKYSVSDETIDYIESVDRKINITVLADEDSFASINEYTVQAMELLKRYRQYNPGISVQYIDLLKNPEVASEYTNVDLNDYDIIFETEVDGFRRLRVVTLGELVSWNTEFTSQFKQYYGMAFEDFCSTYGAINVMNYYGVYILGSSAESAFTSAIMTITDPNPISVSILTGHDEVSELSEFKRLLTANGYEVSEINIMTDEIPEETDLLVIPAPAQDYLDNEITKVSDFLLNDGKLEKDALYIASVQQGDTPNLDEFLEEYGIKVEKSLLLEGDQNRYYGGMPYATSPLIVSKNYMQDMATEDYLLYMPTARPINLLFEEQGMIITEAFAQSSSDAVTCSYDEQGFDASDIVDRGTQTSIAIASKASFLEEDTVYSNIMVIGSEAFLEDEVLQTASFQNSEYVISLLNGMTGKTDTGIVVAPKPITGNTFDLTEAQANTLKWVFQAIIPIVVLVTGLVIYKRRKNK